MKIKIDEKALKKAMKPAMQDIARTDDQRFEDIRVRYTGKSVAEIKPAVQGLFRSNSGKTSDPELTQYAELNSQGKSARMQVE